jgi:hypothetical protein
LTSETRYVQQKKVRDENEKIDNITKIARNIKLVCKQALQQTRLTRNARMMRNISTKRTQREPKTMTRMVRKQTLQ